MVSMDYKGKNFDSNRVQQYAAMRVVMAENMMKKILDQEKHQMMKEGQRKNAKNKKIKLKLVKAIEWNYFCNLISSRN